MSPRIRMVCGECLRSVETSGDGLTRPPESCPYCGGAFESRVDALSEVPPGLTTPLSFDPLSSDEETPNVEPVDPAPLGTVGRFQVREALGGGGFGHVYRAYDPRLDREVALKVLKDLRPGARVMERFFREARAAARLDHPHIIALHDAGRDLGRCWIAYQYVAGQTLSRYREQRRLDFEASAKIARALAEAMDHAHQRGVFHRDLKPSNVIMDELGRPRLTDFGLAKRLDLESNLTREGTILGTPAYMSPEQAAGLSHRADARSDLYSLGVILYEMLCQRRPVELPSGVPPWRAEQAPAAPPRSVNRAIPKALDRICQRALARDPDDRYPDARSMSQDLDDWLRRHQAAAGRRNLLLGLVSGAMLALVFSMGTRSTLWAGPRDGYTVRHAANKPVESPEAASAPPEIAASQLAIPQGRPIGSTPPPPRFAPAPLSGLDMSNHPLIGNFASRKFHLQKCADRARILPANQVPFDSVEEALAQHYSPCGHCHPEVKAPAPPTPPMAIAPR